MKHTKTRQCRSVKGSGTYPEIRVHGQEGLSCSVQTVFNFKDTIRKLPIKGCMCFEIGCLCTDAMLALLAQIMPTYQSHTERLFDPVSTNTPK